MLKLKMFEIIYQLISSGLALSRVRTGPGNPGKSLNLKNKNPGLESPGILLKVLESPGIINRNCKNGIC